MRSRPPDRSLGIVPSDGSLSLCAYIADSIVACPPLADYASPWDMTAHATEIVHVLLPTLGPDFTIADGVAMHRTATVEAGAAIRGPAIVSSGCTVGAHAYLRDGVFLDTGVRIGPSCEVKASFVFRGSALAHLNYVGDSLIGAEVNLEAGAVLANRFNERDDKRIWVVVGDRLAPTGAEKFGALVGDRSRIGANAVTTPGTILRPRSIVGRLELVDQVATHKGRGTDSGR